MTSEIDGLTEKRKSLLLPVAGISWPYLPYLPDYMRLLYYSTFGSGGGGDIGGGVWPDYSGGGGGSRSIGNSEQKAIDDPEKRKECVQAVRKEFSIKDQQYHKAEKDFFSFRSGWAPSSGDIWPVAGTTVIVAAKLAIQGVGKKALLAALGIGLAEAAAGYVGYKFVSGLYGLHKWHTGIAREQDDKIGLFRNCRKLHNIL